MKTFVIVKTGEKIDSLADVTGDYEDWIARGLGSTAHPISVVDVARGETLPPLSEVAAVVVTGSASMVTERSPWMEQTSSWLREAVAEGVPLLGICFGHQMLAQALGGEVGYNPLGVEVGTARIRLEEEAQHDPLFKGVAASFVAQVSHQQSVLHLPPGARALASSDKEPYQAFAYGRCAWGVQFHPEFNARVIRKFIEHYRSHLSDEGASVQRLLEAVEETPDSASLLQHFAHLVRRGGMDNV